MINEISTRKKDSQWVDWKNELGNRLDEILRFKYKVSLNALNEKEQEKPKERFYF
jgi:hypothetical protein